jgi:cytochrome P450
LPITIEAPAEFIHDTTAFIPFSLGPANCAGKSVALLELRGLMCFMVQKFNFKGKEGLRPESWEEEIADYFVIKKPPLPVFVEARR